MSGGFENLGADDWDAELAEDLIGASLLLGLTYLDNEGRVTQRRQIFGKILSCDPDAGIEIALRGSQEIFVMAPVLEAIEPGDPGIYQMADSDDVVTDPDFIALLTVTSPSRI
jgi:hypothetical protein